MKKHFEKRHILVITLIYQSEVITLFKINQYQSLLGSEIDLYSMLTSNSDNW